jgi:hypothetical protein
MHPRQRTKSKGLPATLLCQRDVLCDLAKEYSSFVAATRHEEFGIGHKYDMRADGLFRSAASITGRSVVSQSRPRTSRAVAATTSAALHFSHLIQGQLTPGVCPLAGTPGLQPRNRLFAKAFGVRGQSQSWINENDNFFNLISYIFINPKSARR